MNLINCFKQKDFDKFDNIYTIKRGIIEMWSSGYDINDFSINLDVQLDILKIYKLLKPDAERKYLLLGIRKKYFPIYGHFYNNQNNFIYKKIYNKKIQDIFEPVKYHIIKFDDLAKPAPHNYYKCYNMDNLYNTIELLQKHELPDIYTHNTLVNDADEIASFDNLYTYEHEEITEYLSDDQLKFTYNSETGILHIN